MRQLDEIADRFESAWDVDCPPDFGFFLDQVETNLRGRLAEYLVEVDIELRRKAGEVVRPDSYRDLGEDAVRRAEEISVDGLDATQSFAQPEHSTQDPSQNHAGPLVAPSQLGEYVLEGELGRGGMGVVYRARNINHGNFVALKILPTIEGHRLHRFKREFRSLSGISHRNLISLFSLECAKEGWYFTMELLENATDFRSFVRPNDQLDEERLRACLSQLVSGVSALHSRQIIHCDLKPGNVLVDGNGVLKLLDFGLVSELSRRDMTLSHSNLSGTPIYMAPEQAHSKVIPASDWYAVGVMMYEALCGKRPFSGSIVHVLTSKQTNDAPQLPADPAIPSDLADLCMGLLKRDPQDRPGIDEIESVVMPADSTVIRGSRSGGRNVLGASREALVGREEQLRQLEESFAEFEIKQEPSVVFVSGRSGEGKTVLTETFLRDKRSDPRYAVISGRCYDRESVPFKALDSVIGGIAAYLRNLGEADVGVLIPRDIPFLARLFPVLNRVSVIESAPTPRLQNLDEQQIRTRAFSAFRELLTRISDRSPLVLFIDDLQWGDSDSAEALFEAISSSDAPLIYVIGTYRIDEEAGSQFLSRWKELQSLKVHSIFERRVIVEGLDDNECLKLFVNLIGEDTPAIQQMVAGLVAETGGNPFLLSEVIGSYDPQSQSIQSLSLAELIESKLLELGSTARELLEIVAVSGQAMRFSELGLVCQSSTSETLTLNTLKNLRLLRELETEDESWLDTYHDRIRETVLKEMADSDRRQIHFQIASAISTNFSVSLEAVFDAIASDWEHLDPSILNSGRLFDLSYHFDSAGESEMALIYSLLAAEQANRQYSPQISARQFAVAWRNWGDSPEEIKLHICEGRGVALMTLGQHKQAKECFSEALQYSKQTVDQVRVSFHQANSAYKQGQLAYATKLMEKALRELGVWVPNTRWTLYCGFAKEAVVQVLHRIFSWRLNKRDQTERSDLILNIGTQLHAIYCFQDMIKFAWNMLRSLNKAELHTKNVAYGYATAVAAIGLGMLGFPKLGYRYRAKSLEIANELGDEWLLGISKSQTGIGAFVAGEYDDAMNSLESATNALEKAGDRWELNLAYFHKACCHYGRGDIGDAIEVAAKTIESSVRFIGDTRAMCASWIWSRAAEGDLPFEQLKPLFKFEESDVMASGHGFFSEINWHLFHGRTLQGLELAEMALARVKKSGCYNAHTMLVLPLTAKLRRSHALQGSVDSNEKQILLKKSLTIAKWAVRFSRFVGSARPESLRELSQSYEALGNLKKAKRFAYKSYKIATRQDAQYESAKSYLLYSLIQKKLGCDNEQDIKNAEKRLETFRQILESAKKRYLEYVRGIEAATKK